MCSSYVPPPSKSVFTSAGLALLFAILSQHYFTQQSELLSETLSWVLLPVIFNFIEHLGVAGQSKHTQADGAPQSESSRSLWILAFCLASSSFYRAEYGTVWLYPILLPLIQLVQAYLWGNASISTYKTQSSSNSMQLSVLSGTFAAVILSYGDIVSSALSAIAVLMQFLVYTSLLRSDGSRLKYFPRVYNFQQTVFNLSKKTTLAMMIAIGLQARFLGFAAGEILPTLSLAILKALSWYFIAHTAQQTSWTIAPSIHTTALMCTLQPSQQSSLTRASFLVIGLLLVLAQVIQTLDKKVRFRNYLWMFSLVSLIPYLIHVYAIQSAILDAESTYNNYRSHPIEKLIRSQSTEFHEVLRRQSQTYSAAHKEYERRYNFSPPTGFEGWYSFSVLHKSPIIDEFDTIHRSVSPFWKLSGNQVTQMMETAYTEPGSELWLCKYKSKSGKTTCIHAWRTFDRHITVLFDKLLGSLKGAIPDVVFLVNHLDEPRVVIPPFLHEARETPVNMTDLSHRPIWNEITKSCETSAYEDAIVSERDISTFNLPFVISQESSLDLCRHPEYRKMHGLFQSPTSFRLISGFVPVLSTGAPSSMDDVLFPSPAYIEENFQYNASKDISWDKKINEVYWAGSTTGGFAKNDEWRNFHRQRFVTLSQGLGKRQVALIRKRDGEYQRLQSSFPMNWLFQVAFTRVFQCEKNHCRDQKAHFHIKPWAERDRSLKSRLTFDMDGNGISGRFYQLLASRSLPLKQTLLREWHDDRLFPWVHYIPISQSMEELPETASYLTFSESGQRTAHEIAEQGRVWFSKAFREVDMSIYVYRLLLELARLQDPAREAAVYY